MGACVGAGVGGAVGRGVVVVGAPGQHTPMYLDNTAPVYVTR